jgi:hypothetical protein
MSRNQKIRSKLTIGAVMKAAAAGSAAASHPPMKYAAIAGLAGFVLRLFRSREPLPPANHGAPRPRLRTASKGPARMQHRSSKDARSHRMARAAVWPAATSTSMVAVTKGGLRRG